MIGKVPERSPSLQGDLPPQEHTSPASIQPKSASRARKRKMEDKSSLTHRKRKKILISPRTEGSPPVTDEKIDVQDGKQQQQQQQHLQQQQQQKGTEQEQKQEQPQEQVLEQEREQEGQSEAYSRPPAVSFIYYNTVDEDILDFASDGAIYSEVIPRGDWEQDTYI
ncbi:hypothetical protein AAMO2058_000576600, partial [Amorphochlora amoebiformis]